MSSERWERLAADLRAAGVEPGRIDERVYSETVRGRARSGISRSIAVRRADGCLIEIHDSWWVKNPDVWTGWTVTRSGQDGIVADRKWSLKQRSEVVAAVLRMLDGQTVRA